MDVLSDSQDLRNSGLVRIGGCNQAGAPATVVIAGVPRSGTSMIARALHEAGVYLGEAFQPGVFEDRELADAVDAQDLEALRRIAARNDAVHPVWGFKRPKAYAGLPAILQQLRAPRAIVIMRDPVAIARRNNVSTYKDILASIKWAAKATYDVARMLEGMHFPALIVSYEKALADPQALCNAVLNFIGLDADAAALARMAASVRNGPEDYLTTTAIRYDGEIAIAADGRIEGWIMSNTSAFPPLDLVDGSEIVGELHYGPKFTRAATPAMLGSFHRTHRLTGLVDPARAGSHIRARARDTIFMLRTIAAVDRAQPESSSKPA